MFIDIPEGSLVDHWSFFPKERVHLENLPQFLSLFVSFIYCSISHCNASPLLSLIESRFMFIDIWYCSTNAIDLFEWVKDVLIFQSMSIVIKEENIDHRFFVVIIFLIFYSWAGCAFAPKKTLPTMKLYLRTIPEQTQLIIIISIIVSSSSSSILFSFLLFRSRNASLTLNITNGKA